MARRIRQQLLTDGSAPQSEEQHAGLFDGNGRVARLARWLRDKPTREDVDLLVFEVKGEDGYERAQSWPRAAVTCALATVIDSLAVDAANELGAYLTARVSWWDSERNAAWSTFALRVQPEGMAGAQAFDGSGSNVTIQFQRNLERVAGQYMASIGETVAMARDHAEDTRERARRAERECDTLRERVTALENERLDMLARVRELEDDLNAAMELAEETTKQVEESRKESDENSIVKQIGPAILKSLAGTKAS